MARSAMLGVGVCWPHCGLGRDGLPPEASRAPSLRGHAEEVSCVADNPVLRETLHLVYLMSKQLPKAFPQSRWISQERRAMGLAGLGTRQPRSAPAAPGAHASKPRAQR